ncbi:ketopantoate reductase family protein [Paractinoplanes atraurantiacus]|uniref:2-dehydropantoate 2-reductase n=1 Tax=Paractinoplanes atraurantiacus TaxID=1036182 RepID=A0A285JKS3_9ACTN|nr:ketopantoate reductase family protein [Actinoplanes atraurantiacus]SNY60407.1 2-dehydropantoate 2-reductase [Actinoplanes atraurantiacus]
MRILFVGAGATGGYFGGRLAAAGRDVTFLVRPPRAASLSERGLKIIGPDDTIAVRPRTVTAGQIDGPYDIVVIAVKSYGLEQAMIDLAPAVGPETVVIPLLNGMRHVDELVGAFGPTRAWGGVCMIHASLNADGDVVQMTGLHKLSFGSLDGTERPDVEAALSGTEFDAFASPTIVQDMWEKWVFLASLGAATTLMRATVGDINRAPGGNAFGARIAAEAMAIATAAGHTPRPAAVAVLQNGLSTDQPMTSSMYRDMMAGLPVEADAILGDFVAEADKHGVPVPALSAAYTNLAIYSAQRG